MKASVVKKIPELLQNARKRRQLTVSDRSAYRLFHGEHDGLKGLEIEIYGNAALIRTHHQAIDDILENIVSHLCKVTELETVLLKNHFLGREREQLPLVDGILWGALKSKLLPIIESGGTFFYDTDSRDFFPLADRPLRKWLSTFIAHHSVPRILALGTAKTNILAENGNPEIHCVDVSGRTLIEVTSDLRNLTPPDNGFDFIVMNADFFRNADKNRRALFHLFRNLFKKFSDSAFFAIRTRHFSELLVIFKNLASRSNHRLTLFAEQRSPADFPVELTTNSGREIRYALFELTR